jgi:hypothetical protein
MGIVALGVLAVLMAASQRDPGTGTWNQDAVVEISGVIRATPYPLLERHSPDGTIASILLVNQGKEGARHYAAKLDGQPGSARGHLINRNGMSMLELSDSRSGVINSGEKLSPPLALMASNPKKLTIRGQIVDPKCYLGAMKPGDGKPHKACAVLCIRGGIPPVLISIESSGEPASYLLVDQEGMGLTGASLEAVLPFVADHVEVTGEFERRGDLKLLRVGLAGAIRRL